MCSLILYPEQGLPLNTRRGGADKDKRGQKKRKECKTWPSRAARTEGFIKYTHILLFYSNCVYREVKQDLYSNVMDYYFSVVCEFTHLDYFPAVAKLQQTNQIAFCYLSSLARTVFPYGDDSVHFSSAKQTKTISLQISFFCAKSA